MHILHLLSNHAWSERAEPAADLATAQQAAGADVTFVCGTSFLTPENAVGYQARAKGLDTVVLEMNKHFRLRAALRDAATLSTLIEKRRTDVVHAHMPNAHLIGILAARKAGTRPLIIRSSYEFSGPEHAFRFRFVACPRTDGLIVISERTRATILRRFPLRPEQVEVIEPAIDLARFAQSAEPEPRTVFGLGPDDFVVGVVSRIRKDRRLDIVIEAVARAAPHCPNLRLLLAGRGQTESIVNKPAQKLGIADRIVLPGYCRGERLVSAYRAMDLLVYPMPGTDQSCRTVREAMAAGLPVAASRVGFLPELITDGQTGRLLAPSAEALAQTIIELHGNRAALDAMGKAALEEAQERFALGTQARKTMAFYENIKEFARPVMTEETNDA